MAKQYIGERYTQKLDGEWDSSKTYERLTLVHYDDKGYLSKVDVPAGTLPTNTDYWMLVYNNIINITQVSWGDISGVPTTFPPTDHTQGWDTITDKPTQYPPSAHTHAIAEVNGLPVTISDIQQDIKDLQDSGGGGNPHIIDMYTDMFTGANVPVNNSYTFREYSNGYKIYDAWFQIETVNLSVKYSDALWETNGYILPAATISLLPKAFQGQPMYNVSYTSNRLNSASVWPISNFEPSTFRSVMPNVSLCANTANVSTYGILTISMRGF